MKINLGSMFNQNVHNFFKTSINSIMKRGLSILTKKNNIKKDGWKKMKLLLISFWEKKKQKKLFLWRTTFLHSISISSFWRISFTSWSSPFSIASKSFSFESSVIFCFFFFFVKVGYWFGWICFLSFSFTFWRWVQKKKRKGKREIKGSKGEKREVKRKRKREKKLKKKEREKQKKKKKDQFSKNRALKPLLSLPSFFKRWVRFISKCLFFQGEIELLQFHSLPFLSSHNLSRERNKKQKNNFFFFEIFFLYFILFDLVFFFSCWFDIFPLHSKNKTKNK